MNFFLHNSYLYFLYCSPSTQNCTLINQVSDRIDAALSLDTSAYVFGDECHHSNQLGFSKDTAGSNTQLFYIPFPNTDFHIPHPAPRQSGSASLQLHFRPNKPLLTKFPFADKSHTRRSKITSHDIIKILNTSNVCRSNLIPVILLKICSTEVAQVLSKLFNKCFTESVEKLLLLYQFSGERTGPLNYRPLVPFLFSPKSESLIKHQSITSQINYF